MKIIMINAKSIIKASSVFFKLLALITVLALAINLSSLYFEEAALHIEAVNEITDNNLVIIDAGHGGEDCGAIGMNGVYEKTLNYEIAMQLGEMLVEKGYAVVFTRCDDKLLYTEEENIKGIRKISDLKNRCKIGAEYPNSIFVSIHMNSFGDEKYSGLQVYYSEKNPNSASLAQTIQSSVRDNLQPKNKRTIKEGKGMYLLENLQNPAVLVECGFISNEDECKKLSKKEYQRELCFSIVCAIIKYKEAQEVI